MGNPPSNLLIVLCDWNSFTILFEVAHLQITKHITVSDLKSQPKCLLHIVPLILQ